MASLGRIIYNSMRLASRSVKLAEKRLQIRNQEVLFSAGLEMAERKVEREFERIGTAVKRDLEGYPQVQRKLTEDLMQIEDVDGALVGGASLDPEDFNKIIRF